MSPENAIANLCKNLPEDIASDIRKAVALTSLAIIGHDPKIMDQIPSVIKDILLARLLIAYTRQLKDTETEEQTVKA